MTVTLEGLLRVQGCSGSTIQRLAAIKRPDHPGNGSPDQQQEARCVSLARQRRRPGSLALKKIYEVCRFTSKRHWLPTRKAWIKAPDSKPTISHTFSARW